MILPRELESEQSSFARKVKVTQSTHHSTFKDSSWNLWNNLWFSWILLIFVGGLWDSLGFFGISKFGEYGRGFSIWYMVLEYMEYMVGVSARLKLMLLIPAQVWFCLLKAGHGSNKRPVCSNKLCLLLGTYSFYSLPFPLDYTFIELRQNEPAKKYIKKSSIEWQVNSGLFQNPMNLIFEGKEKREQTCLEKYPVQFSKILPLPSFQLIPAPRCRGGRFFWQLQLFGRGGFCRRLQLPVVNRQGGRRAGGPHLLMKATNWRLTWEGVARKWPGDTGGGDT